MAAQRNPFKQFLLQSRFTLDRITRSSLFGGGGHGLHTAHLAHPYQLSPLATPAFVNEASLLLGVWDRKLPLRVRQTTQRRELGNLACIARTRGGKGLLAKAQILTWTGSIIINDIKGDLFDDTAGFRATMSDVFVFDTRGVGNSLDPFAGKVTTGELRGLARYPLLDADEKNAVFAERAINMLTAILRASRIEGYAPLAYVGHMLHSGMMATVRRLEELSKHEGLAPQHNLTARFLGEQEADANYDSRFLADAWATLTSKMEDVVEDSILACVAGSDFTPEDIIAGERPKTIYLRWPERHIAAFAPLMQLVVSTLMDEMCALYVSGGLSPFFNGSDRGVCFA